MLGGITGVTRRRSLLLGQILQENMLQEQLSDLALRSKYSIPRSIAQKIPESARQRFRHLSFIRRF